MGKYVSTYFSPKRGTINEIIGFIDRCQETIDVAVYSITHDDVCAALIRAQERGVSIRVLTDGLQASSRYADDEKLEAAGIPVRRRPAGGGSLHHKFAIADSNAVGTGSFNWTVSAEERNQENFLIVRLKYVVEEYQNEFNDLWVKFAPEETQ